MTTYAPGIVNYAYDTMTYHGAEASCRDCGSTWWLKRDGDEFVCAYKHAQLETFIAWMDELDDNNALLLGVCATCGDPFIGDEGCEVCA